MLNVQAAAGRQAKEVARVQKFVDRFRYQANKASQVQSRIKQLEKVKMIEIKRDPKRVKFKFPLPGSERPAGPGTPGRRQSAMGKKSSMSESIVRSNGASESRWWEKTAPGKARCSRCWPECLRSRKGDQNGRPWCHPALLRPTPGRNT